MMQPMAEEESGRTTAWFAGVHVRSAAAAVGHRQYRFSLEVGVIAGVSLAGDESTHVPCHVESRGRSMKP